MSATRLATVFDGYDAQGRPLLGPERRPLTDPDERRRVLAYLDGGVILLAGGPRAGPARPATPAGGCPSATPPTTTGSGGIAALRTSPATGPPEPDPLRHTGRAGYRLRVPAQQEIDQASADLQEYFRESTPP